MAGADDVGFLVVQSLWLMLPAYLANIAPVFVGGGAPIDGNRRWRDGRPILGPGKTWRGLVLGPLVATVAIVLLSFVALHPSLGSVGLSAWGGWPWVLLFAYALGLGALVGDAVKSFFKRRLGKERGARWIGPDQLDFVLGAWVFGLVAGALGVLLGYPGNWFLAEFTGPRLLVIGLLTPGLHLAVNWIGHKIGRKEVPW